MKPNQTLLALTLAACGASLLPSAAWARPLAPELREVVIEHPLIKAARKSVEAADSNRDAAFAGYLPKLSISGDRGSEKIGSQSYNPTTTGLNQLRVDSNSVTGATTSSDLARTKFSTTIEQNLFAGGRTAALVSLSDIEFSVQENSFRSTLQNTLLEAFTAYLQVARYRTLIAIAKRNEETTQRQLNLEDERVQRGGGIAVDVLQAKTRLQIAKERRVFNEQGLRDAMAIYRQVFGHEPDLEAIQDVEAMSSGIPKSLVEAIEMAHTQNPQLKEALLQSRKAAKAIELEKAGLYPTVDLVGMQSVDHNAAQQAKREETSVLFKFNWNLFSGLETMSRSKAATSGHEAAIHREASVLRKVEESVRIAWHQMVNGRERQELLENASNISFEVMRNRKRLRDAGKETAINVLDSEVEYYGVLASRVNATYDTRLGAYRLLAATGNLSPQSLGLEEATFAVPVKPLIIQLENPDAPSIPALAPVVAVAKAVPAAVAPTPVSQRPPVKPTDSSGAVKAALDSWAAAWSSRTVEAYLASYSPAFVARGGLPRTAWEQQRTQRLRQPEWIRISMDDLMIQMAGDTRAHVTFMLDYASNRITEKTPKILDLVLENGAWKIVKER
jgi:adhesin transport system outer membrane protein